MYFINPFCMEQPIPSALLNDSQKCELDLECNHSQGQKFKKKRVGGGFISPGLLSLKLQFS